MRLKRLLAATFLAVPIGAFASESGEPNQVPAALPVREVTVFKDGHAFVLQSGRLPVGKDGNVGLDYLPTPVLGTFWPYCTDRAVKLASVTGSTRKAHTDRRAFTIAELLEANPGATATITTRDKQTYSGTIIEVPHPPAPAPIPEDSPKFSYDSGFGGYYNYQKPPQPQTQKSPSTVLLKTTENTTVVLLLDTIKSVTFRGRFRRDISDEEEKHRLDIKLEWPDKRTPNDAGVGLVYLQKGIRWIPSYRVSIDGKGKALVRLQATLVNELVDLHDVTANLVIGVPNFYFKDSPDPISLQQTFPKLSQYFQSGSETSIAFSNAIMGQGGFGGGGFGGGSRCGDPGDMAEEVQNPIRQGPLGDVAADKTEDLYVFTLRHVSINKGQSLAIPVAEYTLPYRDVFVAEVPFAPDKRVERTGNRQQEAELAALVRAPKVQHRLRITNTSTQPLTTAPAMVVAEERVVAQTMAAYTPVKGELDLAVTNSGEITIKKTDREARGDDLDGRNKDKRSENDQQVNFVGTISLTNHRDTVSTIMVVRYVPFEIDSANENAKVTKISSLDETPYATSFGYPYWWEWYDWNYYWSRYNSLYRVEWTRTLKPAESVDLHIFWHK